MPYLTIVMEPQTDGPPVVKWTPTDFRNALEIRYALQMVQDNLLQQEMDAAAYQAAAPEVPAPTAEEVAEQVIDRTVNELTNGHKPSRTRKAKEVPALP